MWMAGKREDREELLLWHHLSSLSLSRSLCLTRASERRSEPFTQNEDESRVVLICYVSIIYRPCAVHNVNITYHIPPRFSTQDSRSRGTLPISCACVLESLKVPYADWESWSSCGFLIFRPKSSLFVIMIAFALCLVHTPPHKANIVHP
jgi:hypothetical protein